MRPQRAFLIGFLFVVAAAWPLPAFAAQLTLTWIDSSDNEAGFKVERRTGSTGTYAEIVTSGANTTSYVDPSLAASIT